MQQWNVKTAWALNSDLGSVAAPLPPRRYEALGKPLTPWLSTLMQSHIRLLRCQPDAVCVEFWQVFYTEGSRYYQ